MPTLEIHLTLRAGREAECARFLRGEVRDPETWKILAALAAELVAIHESEAAGATTLVIQVSDREKTAILQGRR